MIQYHVTVGESDPARLDWLVRVRWNFDASTGSPAKEAISTLLTSLKGVNEAVIRRYDADLRIAAWIVSRNEFVESLIEELEDDRQITFEANDFDRPDITWDGWHPSPAWYKHWLGS